MKTLKELENNERIAVASLSLAKSEIKKYWLKSHKENYGVYPGVIVVCKSGKRAIIESVEARKAFGGKPWIKGRIEKKDKTFGTAIRSIYSDWDICES